MKFCVLGDPTNLPAPVFARPLNPLKISSLKEHSITQATLKHPKSST